MIPGQPIVLSIDESSKVGEARRVAVNLARGIGFDETERGHVALVVTEAATNLLNHAHAGVLILQTWELGQARGFEVLSLDRGPGIVDLDRCLRDGFSTGGSLGHGLGAISRLSSSLDIESVPGVGTALSARLWAGAAPRGGPGGGLERLEWGVVSLPLAGEEVCGDAWGVADDAEGRTLIAVVDGLGHGPQAAEAARAAIQVFHTATALGPAGIIRAAHGALQSTRGAAMAVARLDPHRRELLYCGVGNIAGTIVKPGEGRSQSLVTHNGTVGHTIRKTQEFTYPWEEGSLVVIHSDGLASHWQLGRYPGLLARHPSLIAGVLYRDSARGRDDVTVLAVRERSEDDR